MAEVISVTGVALAAVLAYVLGLSRDRRAHLRAEQVRATTEFCRLLMEYSGWQLRRRTDELEDIQPEDAEVTKAVRTSRAAVWAAYFHVVLVIDDSEAAGFCRQALDSAAEVRRASDRGDAVKRAEAVRVEAERFVRRVATKLGVDDESLSS